MARKMDFNHNLKKGKFVISFATDFTTFKGYLGMFECYLKETEKYEISLL